MSSTLLVAPLLVCLSFIVVLQSARAKDVVIASTQEVNFRSHEEVKKLGSDLHSHVDKQILKSLSHDGAQVDGRSLRLIRQANDHHYLYLLKGKLGRWWHQIGSLVSLF